MQVEYTATDVYGLVLLVATCTDSCTIAIRAHRVCGVFDVSRCPPTKAAEYHSVGYFVNRILDYHWVHTSGVGLPFVLNYLVGNHGVHPVALGGYLGGVAGDTVGDDAEYF